MVARRSSGFSFSTKLLLVALLFLCFFVATLEARVYTQPLYRSFFRSEKSFKRKCDKIFNALDDDKDNVVEISKINEVIVDKLDLPEHARENITTKIIDELNAKDGDKDGRLAREELSSALLEAFSTEVTIDTHKCRQIKSIMKPCSRGLLTGKDISSTFDRSDYHIVHDNCRKGLSSLDDFNTEQCILEVFAKPGYQKGSETSCQLVKKCVNRHMERTEATARSGDMTYANKRIKAFSVITWTGLFAALILVIPALIVQPLIWLGVWAALFINFVGFWGVMVWTPRANKVLDNNRRIAASKLPPPSPPPLLSGAPPPLPSSKMVKET